MHKNMCTRVGAFIGTPQFMVKQQTNSLPVNWQDLSLFSEKYITAYSINIFCQYADPKLPSLLKMLIWAQNQLDEKAAYPRITDLSTATLEDPPI